jgi:hypothetical protein
VGEEVLAVIPPAYDVVNGSRILDALLAWHSPRLGKCLVGGQIFIFCV